MNAAAEQPADRSSFPPPAGQPVRSTAPIDAGNGIIDDGRLHLTDGGWWRRNRRAVLAILILVPLTGGLMIGNGLRKARPYSASEPIVVDADQPATLGESTIGPVTAFFRSEPGPAPDSRVLSVEIPVSGAAPFGCTITLREVTGDRREWSDATLELPDLGVVSPTSCNAEAPFTIEGNFLIPAAAEGPFTIDVKSQDFQPKFLRFAIRPNQ